jgi:hypothetical protein
MYGIEEKIIKWIKGKKADKVTAKKASNVEDGANDSENSQTQQTSTQTKKTSDSKMTYDKLIENLTSYNKKLEELSPSEEELKPPTSLTDSQIKNQVTLEVDSKYNDDYDALKNDLIKTTEEIKNEYGESVEKANKKQEENTANYKESIEKAKNDALKKGVSRSSIVTSALAVIDEQYRNNIKEIKSNLQKELQKNQDKIKTAQDEYKNAVNDLDVKKAVELKQGVEKIKKEQQKMLEDYYKNSTNLGTYNAINANGEINQEMIDVYEKIIKDSLTYYTSMPADKARESFEGDLKIKELLGNYAKTIEMYLKSFT